MANAQYAILRFAKYKGSEISGIEAHNERTKEKYASNPDIDPSRTHLNFHFRKSEYVRTQCFVELQAWRSSVGVTWRKHSAVE